MYEYVVWDNHDDCVHRGPWSEQDCIEWLDECRELFPTGNVDDVWSVRRRAVGEWESYE